MQVPVVNSGLDKLPRLALLVLLFFLFWFDGLRHGSFGSFSVTLSLQSTGFCSVEQIAFLFLQASQIYP